MPRAIGEAERIGQPFPLGTLSIGNTAAKSISSLGRGALPL